MEGEPEFVDNQVGKSGLATLGGIRNEKETQITSFYGKKIIMYT